MYQNFLRADLDFWSEKVHGYMVNGHWPCAMCKAVRISALCPILHVYTFGIFKVVYMRYNGIINLNLKKLEL